MRRGFFVLVAVAATVAAACGQPMDTPVAVTTGPQTSESVTTLPTSTLSGSGGLQTLGSCPPDSNNLDFTVLPERLAQPEAWYESSTAKVLNGAAVGPGSVELAVVGSDMTLLGGSLSEPGLPITMARSDYDRLALVEEEEAVLLGVRHSISIGGPVASIVLVESATGSLYFVGACAGPVYTVPFNDYFETVGTGTPRALLLAASLDPEANEALTDWMFPSEQSTSWHDIDPSLRVLDNNGTPQEVLDPYRLIDLVLHVPDSWRVLPAVVCTRVVAGWNECAALDAAEPGETISMLAYASAGEPLEVWLVDEEVDIGAPLALLGTLSVQPDVAILTVKFLGAFETVDEVVDASTSLSLVEITSSE